MLLSGQRKRLFVPSGLSAPSSVTRGHSTRLSRITFSSLATPYVFACAKTRHIWGIDVMSLRAVRQCNAIPRSEGGGGWFRGSGGSCPDERLRSACLDSGIFCATCSCTKLLPGQHTTLTAPGGSSCINGIILAYMTNGTVRPSSQHLNRVGLLITVSYEAA